MAVRLEITGGNAGLQAIVRASEALISGFARRTNAVLTGAMEEMDTPFYEAPKEKIS